jgi:uncharacterized protein with HEPN domain
MPHRIDKLLVDIALACDETLSFCGDKAFDDFTRDRLLQLALERQFEIIGEALYRLERVDEANLVLKIPEYRKIIGLRNIIAHGYDLVDDAALWDFAVNKIPELKVMVNRY